MNLLSSRMVVCVYLLVFKIFLLRISVLGFVLYNELRIINTLKPAEILLRQTMNFWYLAGFISLQLANFQKGVNTSPI